MGRLFRIRPRAVCCGLGLIAIFTATGSAKSSYPSREQLGGYAGESFRSASSDLYLYTLQGGGGTRYDSFVQLRLDPAHRVLTSLHWPDRHDIDAEWSPNGKAVAVSYRVLPSDFGATAVFRATPAGLVELKVPQGLRMDRLLPKSDPVWNLSLDAQKVHPLRWLDKDHLVVEVAATFKGIDGYADVAYEVTTVVSQGGLKILSSRQSRYNGSE